MLSSCRVLPTRVGGRPGRARLPPSRFYPRLVVHEIGCRTLYTMCFRVQTPGLGMAGAGPASTKWLLPIGATALHCTAMHCAAGVSCARQEPSCAMLSFTGSYKSSRSREALRHPLGPPPWLGSGERCFPPVGLYPPDWLWTLNTTCFVFQSPHSRAGDGRRRAGLRQRPLPGGRRAGALHSTALHGTVCRRVEH